MRFQRRAGTLLTTAVALAACGSPEADIPTEEDVPMEEVRTTIRESIRTEDDALTLVDPRSGEPLPLAFNYVHEGVSETPGGRYVACVDFLGPDGTAYDVDYYVARGAEEFRVEAVVLHKAGEATVLADSTRARLEEMESGE